MRIAVVEAGNRGSDALAAISVAMARAFGEGGHIVDRVGPQDETRLSSYDYIVLCSEPAGLGGKIGTEPARRLAASGNIAGRRSMAVMRKTGFAPAKALSRLMAVMEAEGMVVSCGELIANAEQAGDSARGAPVERN